MIYSTGTISINGNTATGSGTNWTAPASQVRAGQTIIVMSNPVQMFQISSVNSATSMTVTPAASPALSGQNYGILVSDNISVDGLALAMSQLIKEYDENIGAWETFATTSANQNITVTINGTSLSIPALGKLLQKGSNGALPVNQGGTGSTTEEGARTNLGLGSSATKNIGTVAGTVAAGDDNRLLTINNKSGGTVDGSIYATAGSDIGLKNSANVNGIKIWNNAATISPGAFVGYLQAKWFDGGLTLGPVRGDSTDVRAVQLYVGSDGSGSSFNFFPDGRAVGNWQPVSDIRVKSLLETIPEPLVAMESMRGYSWFYENTQTQGFGFVASEARTYFPGAIKNNNMTYELPDGEKIENVESVDTYGIAAALHHEAILAIMGQVQELKAEIAKLKGQ
ncbi:tail fiber domain-containing protein [Escherichia coli]|uniref:tail fiber domain-containing protein n=1 Tax=Escherichia coli TaxID=562 RepID=UPI0028A45D0E|nr:tail fiber domain-containing protein [Escherichia coli]MDT4543475.1 tail fiber domain-containing protein [Escherichia coli]MDT4547526.1 tail fiber domain-containing protein [Escherichia coli]MDT4596513.1 tail fiber domain-containing protein [Escherichia coli]